MFSNFQTSSQSSKYVPSSSLAQKVNFLKTLITTSRIKSPWIIDVDTSDHMTDDYHIFSSYLPCVGNFKVKIAYGTHLLLEKRELKFLTITL